MLESKKVVLSDGTIKWFNQYGKEHRTDGPAVIHPNGDMAWFQKGELHREDGPAIVRDDGTKIWFQKGELHRRDGQAIERSDGSDMMSWWLNGKLISNFSEYIRKADLSDEEIVLLKMEHAWNT